VTRYCWLPVGATKGARLLRGSAICSSTPLMCREIPVSAVRGVLAVPTLPKVAFPRTRQEPPVNLGFSQGHKERGRAWQSASFSARPQYLGLATMCIGLGQRLA
jgi:hypothetical protein